MRAITWAGVLGIACGGEPTVEAQGHTASVAAPSEGPRVEEPMPARVEVPPRPADPVADARCLAALQAAGRAGAKATRPERAETLREACADASVALKARVEVLLHPDELGERVDPLEIIDYVE